MDEICYLLFHDPVRYSPFLCMCALRHIVVVVTYAYACVMELFGWFGWLGGWASGRVGELVKFDWEVDGCMF